MIFAFFGFHVLDLRGLSAFDFFRSKKNKNSVKFVKQGLRYTQVDEWKFDKFDKIIFFCVFPMGEDNVFFLELFLHLLDVKGLDIFGDDIGLLFHFENKKYKRGIS